MALGTGMGTGMGTGNQKKAVTQKQAMASLTQEEREKVAKAKFPMELANALRLLFIVVAVMGLLFIFFGGKFWEGIGWFESAKQSVYNFLLWDILLMVLATFAKVFFVARYNHVVKNL